MGIFDQAKEAVTGHRGQVDSAVEKGGDLVDEKTGGKHADKVDVAQDKISEGLDKL